MIYANYSEDLHNKCKFKSSSPKHIYKLFKVIYNQSYNKKLLYTTFQIVSKSIYTCVCVCVLCKWADYIIEHSQHHNIPGVNMNSKSAQDGFSTQGHAPSHGTHIVKGGPFVRVSLSWPLIMTMLLGGSSS